MSRHTCTNCASSDCRPESFLRHHATDHEAATQRRRLVVLAGVAEFPHQIDDRRDGGRRQAGAGSGDGDFKLAISMSHVDGHDAVAKRILGIVNAGIFLRIAGEDDAKIRVHLDVRFVLVLRREHQQSFLKHAEKHVVGLRPGARELVIDEGVALPACRGQPVVGPALLGGLLGLGHVMDEAVDDLADVIAALAANQRPGRHLFIAGDHDDRPIEQRRSIHCQGGLAGTCRAAEMHRESRIEISQRTPDDRFDSRRLHEVRTPPRRQRVGNARVLQCCDDRHVATPPRPRMRAPCVSSFSPASVRRSGAEVPERRAVKQRQRWLSGRLPSGRRLPRI